MTRIVIEEVDSMQDLLTALAIVHQAFVQWPEKFASDEEVFSKSPPVDCDCGVCRAREDDLDRQVQALLPEGWHEDDAVERPERGEGAG